MTTDTDTLLRMAEAAQAIRHCIGSGNLKQWHEFQNACDPAAIIALCKRVKELEEYEWKYKDLCK